MATNTGNGFRRGAVRGRSQSVAPNGMHMIRGPDGRYMRGQKSPAKGIRKEY